VTIIGAAAVFTVTGFVAALLPALRASKIDPMDALRQG
jgi:ABC-type antimicrobial peptide transport system permease subunit